MTAPRPPADDGLGELRELWQAQPAQVDVAGLRASLRRRQRQTRWMMAMDALAMIGAVGLVAWVLAHAATVETIVWASFMLVLGGIATGQAARIRRRVWSAAEAERLGVLAMVGASIRQAQAALALIRVIYWVVGACFAFLAAWLVIETLTGHLPAGDALGRRLLACALAVAWGLLFVVGGAIKARGKRREIARWQALARSLGEVDE